MMQEVSTVLAGNKTTTTDICRWAQALFLFHQHIAARFARLEPRRRVLLYLQGILSETARKNGLQLAEFAGEEHPHGMQRLLSQAVWDTDGVRDNVRSHVVTHLGREHAVLAIDETSLHVRYHQHSFPRRKLARSDVPFS